jgi:hypothetical protein
MAILRQADYSLTFSVGAGDYAVGGGASAPAGVAPAPDVAAFASGGAGGAGEGSVVVPGAPAPAAGSAEEPSLRPGSPDSFKGALDRVRIDSVSLQGGAQVRTGSVGITYERNGRCTPFEVTLVDEDGQSMKIRVDAVGSIRAGDEKNAR